MASGLQNEEDKAQSKSVALLGSMWTNVDAIADSEYRGNRTLYFKELVEADFKRRGITDSADAVNELVRELVAVRGAEAVRAKLEELHAEFVLTEAANTGGGK